VADKLFADPAHWFFSYGAARSLAQINAAYTLMKNQYFIDKVNADLLDLLSSAENGIGQQAWDNAFYVIQYLERVLTATNKSKLADLLIERNRNFGQNVRLKMLKFLMAGTLMPDKDERWVKVVKAFSRSIKPDVLTALAARIDGGLDNPDVKAILGKSKMFNYLKYTEIDVQDKREVKIQLLRDIAQTQTVLKRIPFNFTIELEHIKELPPVARLNFLMFAFQDEINVFCRQYYYWHSYSLNELQKRVSDRKRRKHLDKMKIAPIEPELIKDLLFSVALQKNEEVNKWFEDYTTYYNLATGIKKIEETRY
jgi:hypothetical protein